MVLGAYGFIGVVWFPACVMSAVCCVSSKLSLLVPTMFELVKGLFKGRTRSMRSRYGSAGSRHSKNDCEIVLLYLRKVFLAGTEVSMMEVLVVSLAWLA